MRKFLKTLTLVAVAAMGTVSCTENMADDTITPSTTGGVTLYATTPGDDTSTRIEFTESEDGSKISLTWEAGDYFTLYDANSNVVDTYTTANGDGNFTPSSSDTTLTEGDTYRAIYNANIDDSTLAIQDGDAIASLNNVCFMAATFEYGTDAIEFEHLLAIMTFKFKSEVTPAKLVFKNGNLTYIADFTSIEPVDGIYTSHIMIMPSAESDRTLTFSLYDDDDATEAYDIYTVESSKAYLAGCRYTADLTSFDQGGDITVSYIDFKDPNFKEALLASNYNPDTNGDNEISYEEASATTTISVSSKSITSMAELEYFTNLTGLSCSYNSLTALDVSKNTKLEILYCHNNSLTALDVSYNTNLTYLTCLSNKLTALDVSKNTKLEILQCSGNSLTKLDVSQNTNLTSLSCHFNSLSALDVSQNTNLTTLFCYLNNISTLDVSHNTNLITLFCSANNLSALDVSKNTDLINLYCSDNSLTKLDLSYNSELSNLNCSNNNLSLLDVSNCSSSIWENYIESDLETIYNYIAQYNSNLTLYVSTAQWDNGLSYLNDDTYSGVTAIEVSK